MSVVDDLPEALSDVDARVRRAIGEPPLSRDLADDVVAAVRARTPSPRRARAVAAAAALALGGVAVVVATRPTETGAVSVPVVDDGFRAKGGAPQPTYTTRFFVSRGGTVARLEDTMRADDALLVAYTNVGPAPARALAVFAVDARGEVFFLYPAHTDPTRTPSSIAIESGVQKELPDAVRHAYAPGPLRLVSLFTLAPVSVDEIERFVVDAALRPGDAPARFPGGVLDVTDVRVTP